MSKFHTVVEDFVVIEEQDKVINLSLNNLSNGIG